MPGAFRVELRDVVVRDVLAVDAHRAAAFDEVEARQVVDRRRRGDAGHRCRRPSRTRAGRATTRAAAARARSRRPRARRAPRPDRTTGSRRSRRRPRSAVPPATGPTKNHVANRFGEMSGVVQLEKCTSASGSTSTPASSFASRAAARRAAASRSSGVVAVVVGIDATAGEHPGAAVELQLRRPLPEQHLESVLTVAQQHDGRGRRGLDAGRLRACRVAVPQSNCSTTRSPFSCRARSTFLSNFPTDVFGTSSMKLHRSGTCHFATRVAEELATARPRRRPRRP